MIMDRGNQRKNRIFADFSIETLLRKDNESTGNSSRKSWGVVQHSNFLSPSTANSPVCFQDSYSYFPVSTGGSDVSVQESAAEIHPQEDEDEELISVSDDNDETNNAKVCRKSDNDGQGEDSSSNGTFAWLTCTRFKPPKLPRTRRKSTSRRHGRGPRIPFSTHQLAVLESTFISSQYLSSDAIVRLAETLNLTETRVKIWFQNRRARFRREKDSSSFSHSRDFQGSASSNFIPTAEATDMTLPCDIHRFSSPNKSSANKHSFRHLINDLNLMAASASAGSSVVDSKRILYNLDTYRISEAGN